MREILYFLPVPIYGMLHFSAPSEQSTSGQCSRQEAQWPLEGWRWLGRRLRSPNPNSPETKPPHRVNRNSQKMRSAGRHSVWHNKLSNSAIFSYLYFVQFKVRLWVRLKFRLLLLVLLVPVLPSSDGLSNTPNDPWPYSRNHKAARCIALLSTNSHLEATGCNARTATS